MDRAVVTVKGQIVIPKAIREALRIRPGTQLDVVLKPGKGFEVWLRSNDHVERVRALAGALAHRAHALTPREEEAAMLRAVRAADDATRTRVKASRKRRKG